MISIPHIFGHSCLSQEGQNVFHFDIFIQITQTIHLEKSLSNESESTTFYENVFNGAMCNILDMIRKHIFRYTQLKDQTVLYLTIQFSISHKVR